MYCILFSLLYRDVPDPHHSISSAQSHLKTVEGLCKESVSSIDELLSPYHELQTHLNKIKQNFEKIIKSTSAISTDPADGHLTPIEILDFCHDASVTINDVLDFSDILLPHMREPLRAILYNMTTIIANR